MAKGKSSANSLKRIEHALSLFIASWEEPNRNQRGSAASHVGNVSTGQNAWPAPYQVAIIRGEGILRERFFKHFIPKLPLTLNPTQTLELWTRLVEHNAHITDLMNRIGIHATLRREAPLPEQANAESRTLYTILLTALSDSAFPLLNIAVEQFLLHCWKQEFGTHDTPHKAKRASPETLRDNLIRALRKTHKSPVEIKESFQEVPSETGDKSHITFKILTRKSPAEPWATLIEVDRPRLSTARNAAYTEATRAIIGE